MLVDRDAQDPNYILLSVQALYMIKFQVHEGIKWLDFGPGADSMT